MLHLRVDLPAEAIQQCRAAVKWWRWRNIARTVPQLKLGDYDHAAATQPVRRLIRSKQNDDEWNGKLKGAPCSALANRQWTQQRLSTAGLANHDRCLACLQENTDVARQHEKKQEWFEDEVDIAKT